MNGAVEPESGRMTKTKCLIWGTPAFEYPSHGDEHFIDSPRAGGKYLVVGTSAAVLESCDDPVKARLTSWLIEQRQLGIKWPEIYSPTISEAQQRQALQVPECADGILRYLKAKSKTLGTIVRYSVFIDLYDKSLMTPTEQEKEYLCLLAHSECINMDDLSFLMEYLQEMGLIKIGGDDKVKGCNLYQRPPDLTQGDSHERRDLIQWHQGKGGFDGSKDYAQRQVRRRASPGSGAVPGWESGATDVGDCPGSGWG